MSNILQHNIERFGMVTVMDVVLYEVGSTNPVLQLDTLKMTNISVEGSAKEIRGGIGNDMLINYDFGRTANIEMQDALISPVSLAFLWGLNINLIDAAGATKYDVVETYTTSGSGALTFNQKVGSANVVDEADKVFVLAADGSEKKHWGALAKSGDNVTVTFTDSDDDAITAFSDNKAYKVFFQRQSSAGQSITLKNDNFPTAVRMVGTTFVIDQDSGKKKLVQIEIPKLKINSNFSFTMDAEGDASVFDFSGVALAQGGELITLRYLGDY
jgi:hypothetical protein